MFSLASYEYVSPGLQTVSPYRVTRERRKPTDKNGQ